MTSQTALQEALLELRRSEEADCLLHYRSLRRQLRETRLRIHAIEETIAKCSRQADIASRHGNDTVARGNRREVQGLRLRRARQVGKLAGIKAQLAKAHERWQEAREQRLALNRPTRIREQEMEKVAGH